MPARTAYAIGIDLGPTRTAAAVCWLDGPERGLSTVHPVRLGRQGSVPAELWLADDGAPVMGDAIAQHAHVAPNRLARRFVERVGDDVPVVIDGEQYLAEELTAALVRWVVDAVEHQQGDAATRVVLAHPAGWGDHRRGLMHSALRRLGLYDVTLLPRPIAAAESHANRDRVETGSLLAVSHHDGESVESAVVRRLERGTFAVLGHAESAGVGDDWPGRPDTVVQSLLRCVRSIGVQPRQLAGVVLAGSPAPGAGPAVAAAVPCPVAGDHEPESGVACGAALAALRDFGFVDDEFVEGPAELTTVIDAVTGIPVDPSGHCLSHDPSVPPPRPPVEVSPLDLPETRPSSRFRNLPGSRPTMLGIALAVMALGVTLTLVFHGGGGQSPTPNAEDRSGVRPMQTVSNMSPTTEPAVPTPTEGGR